MKRNLLMFLVLAVGMIAALSVGVAWAEQSASGSATSGDSSSSMSSSDQGTTSDSTMSSSHDNTSNTNMGAEEDTGSKKGYGSVQSGTGGTMGPGMRVAPQARALEP